MKLIFCDRCSDVFKLHYKLRSCSCGKCKGKYDDNGATAVTNGKGYALAIGNGSLLQTVMNGEASFGEYHSSHDGSRMATFLAWHRPHDGPSNPRSRVDPDLE